MPFHNGFTGPGDTALMELNQRRAPCWARNHFLQRNANGAAGRCDWLLAGLLALAFSGTALAQPAAVPVPTAVVTPAAPKFDILEYEITGNTRLSATQIEAAVLPFLGEQLSMAEVDAARAALEKAYQTAGYLSVFVDVPEQRVDGGVIRLAVLEGRVGLLRVTGARYYAQGRIRDAVPELAVGQVPNFNLVQQQLAEVSRGDERRVLPVTRAGRLPGTMEIDLQVEDRLPLGGSVELSNAAATGTDPLRMAVNLHYDNFLQRDHSIAMTVLGAPAALAQSKVFVFNYLAPLSGGSSLALSYVNSSSDLESLGGTRVLGRGTTMGLRYAMTRPLPNSTHSLSLGLDYKNLSEDVITSAGMIAAPLRYMPLQAGYNGSWWGESSQQQLSVTAVVGLRPLLQTQRADCQLADGTFGSEDQFACKRRNADGGFSTLRFDWRGTQRLGAVELAGRLSAQLSTQALTSAEQFAVGGADTVRGYAEGAAAGDMGLLASLELRSRNLAPSLLAAIDASNSSRFSELVVYGFVDAARISLQGAEVGQQRRTPLLGSGLGLRLGVRPGISLALDWAQRHRPVPGHPDADSQHVHLRAALRF